ncbi:MAG: DUF4331 family protein [Isosphaeraceae bacterium]|nr:DUF4331 family protein [Isosphaeraceae bacterium]
MQTRRMRATWFTAALAASMVLHAAPSRDSARASDHADTAENVNRISIDLTDLYIFPSATDPSKVVFVMCVRGLIPTGQGATASFDPSALYQFKIDNTGDSVEDLVIQARFQGAGPQQKVHISGPAKPSSIGTRNVFGRRQPGVGTINQTFQAAPGIQVFAGVREEPFFLDLEQFYTIFPDRMTPLTGMHVDTPNPNAPQAVSWRPNGVARDFLAGFNVLSIVIEMPRALLAPTGGVPGRIGVWMTTSIPAGRPIGSSYVQQERLARPLINEVLVTVSNRRHEANNKSTPTQDPAILAGDLESFLTFPAGRSPAIRNIFKAVAVPDVMIADLASSDPASYLGVETGGFTGGRFGGRALDDDVVDLSCSLIFGTAISDLGLAPADGQQIPALTSDNVGPDAKHFLANFPYLGDPR